MSDSDRVEDLFGDGWRDPGDDLERTSILIAFALMALLGPVLIGVGLVGAVAGGRALGETSAAAANTWRLLGPIAALIGLSFLGFGGTFLAREFRRGEWRGMTADRFVAGGFLVGLAVAGFGFFMLRAAGGGGRGGHDGGLGLMLLTGGCLALGVVILLVFLGIGLVCAFGGGRFTNQEFAVRSVLARYAVEPDGECAYDHPCPQEDGLQGWISFRSTDGRKHDFRATPDAYARAYSGDRYTVKRGVVVSVGNADGRA